METVNNELLTKLSKIDGYQPTKQRVKQFSGNLLVWLDDSGHLTATSYGHWTFVKFVDGLYIFNDYSYSVTTSRHQREMMTIMEKLGLDFICHNQREKLDYVMLLTILNSKIDSLYTGENTASMLVNNANKERKLGYASNTFDNIFEDIKKLAAAMKLTAKQLNQKLIDAENKASENMLNELLDKHEKQVSKKAIQKENDSLLAIAI